MRGIHAVRVRLHAGLLVAGIVCAIGATAPGHAGDLRVLVVESPTSPVGTDFFAEFAEPFSGAFDIVHAVLPLEGASAGRLAQLGREHDAAFVVTGQMIELQLKTRKFLGKPVLLKGEAGSPCA